ncbi:MAG: germination protein YpeB [Bacillota bacterium]
MKNQDKNTNVTKGKATKEKIEITGEMDEIGFDDKRSETTKVVKKTQIKPTEKKQTVKTETVKKTAPKAKKEEAPKSKREIRAEKAYAKKLSREEKRSEKAKSRSARKIQKAKEKEALKELKKDRVAYIKAKEEAKAERVEKRAEKATARREKFDERKDNFKGKMSQRKEDRAERKLHKHEDKIRRASMTKEEKKAHRDAKKAEQKARRIQARAEKSQKKAEKAHAIAELKSQGIKVGSSKGLVAAVIAVSIVGGMAVLSTVALAGTNAMYMREIDRSYMQSYYDVMQSANNLSSNLAKTTVSNGTSGLVATFSKASSDAFMAEHSLENIPSKEREGESLIKFFNQAGEFSKMIAQKCANGEELSSSEQELITQIAKTAVEIKEQINKAYATSMHGERKMHAVSNMFKGEIYSDVTDNIQKLSSSSIQFPTMIYDGPFSDSKNIAQDSTALPAEISKEQAMQTLQEKLGAGDVKFITETNSETMSTYDFAFTKHGVEVYAQVDKHCGTIVMIDADKRVAETKLTKETAEAKAVEYLKIAGFEDMVKVWAETSGNITTFNFAKFQNGAVVYPQLVKVKVALSDGAVLGAEGYSYVKNHKERSEKPTITIAEARSKINKNLNVQTEKLVVIPSGNSEKLCYEFCGEVEGQTYFVYIDAKTGNQADVLMVVENATKGSQVI